MKMVRDLITPETTVLWSTAYLDEAHSFDTAVVLNNGKVIYEGKPHDLASTPQEFENKVIDLMGGYKKEKSLIAENYSPIQTDIECTVVADNLEKKYGNFYAVKNNSFCIKRGEIFGLLGPNGAGKSTSFKMMCGLAKPTSRNSKTNGCVLLKILKKLVLIWGIWHKNFLFTEVLLYARTLNFLPAAYGIGLFDRKKRIDEIIQVFGFSNIENQKSEGFAFRLQTKAVNGVCFNS